MAQTATWAVGAAPSGLSMRNTVNTILDVLRTSSSGASAPSPTVGGMLWLDTGVSPPVMRIRNAANTAWIEAQAETLPANTIRGNATGGAAAETNVTAAQLRTMLGFPTGSAGLGNWTIQYFAQSVNVVLPAGGTWAWILLNRITSTSAIGTLNASVGAGGSTLLSGAVGQDNFVVVWRVA